MDPEIRIQILEERFKERRESYYVPGLVPYLRDAKRDDETWREFKERIDVSAGFVKLKRWCRRGEMPSWWVAPLRGEIAGEEHPPQPRVPREVSPLKLAHEKNKIRKGEANE